MLAERVLAPGGRLAVVTFHPLEDRIGKRYLRLASGGEGTSRHAPAAQGPAPRFEKPDRPVTAREAELDANPRARSARLRVARRTAAAPVPLSAQDLGAPAPQMDAGRRGRR